MYDKIHYKKKKEEVENEYVGYWVSQLRPGAAK